MWGREKEDNLTVFVSWVGTKSDEDSDEWSEKHDESDGESGAELTVERMHHAEHAIKSAFLRDCSDVFASEFCDSWGKERCLLVECM